MRKTIGIDRSQLCRSANVLSADGLSADDHDTHSCRAASRLEWRQIRTHGARWPEPCSAAGPTSALAGMTPERSLIEESLACQE